MTLNIRICRRCRSSLWSVLGICDGDEIVTMPGLENDESLLFVLLFRIPDVFVSLIFLTSVDVDDDGDDGDSSLELVERLLPGIFRRFHISRAIIALKTVNANVMGRNTKVNIKL